MLGIEKKIKKKNKTLLVINWANCLFSTKVNNTLDPC